MRYSATIKTMSTTHMDDPTSLAAIIRSHQDKTRDSYRTIAAKTGLSKSTVAQLASLDQPYLVRADTLKKLSEGINVPLSTLKRAALGTAGYSAKDATEDDPTLTRIIDRLREMPESDLLFVESIVQSVEQRREA